MAARIASVGSLLARQLNAYGDLVGEDLRAAGRAFRTRLWAGAAIAVAGLFLVELGCVGLIAAAWDTPGRLWVIGALCAFFGVALIAGAIAWRVVAATPLQFLVNTRYEWSKDRALIQEFADAADGTDL